MSLPRSVHVCYGLGGLGTGVFATVPGLLLSFYLTDTLAVPAALAGLAVFLPKLWDAVSDPLMGVISDRARTRWGRRRPFMLAGALLLPLCLAALFSAPRLETPAATFAYVLLIYTLCTTSFTIFVVPFVAMPAEMTGDRDEVTTITAWRMAFTTVGVLVGGVAPMIVKFAGGGRPGYKVMSIAVATVCFSGLISAFLGTRRAPYTTRSEERVPLGPQVRLALQNRPFFVLLAAYVVQLVGVGCVLATVPYFAKYILGGPGGDHEATVTALFLCIVVPAVVTMPVWSALSRRLGKKRAFALSIAGFALFCSGLALADEISGALVFTLAAAMGLFYAGTQLLPFSMLPDTIACDRARSGMCREGVFSGLWMAGDKGGVALGALITTTLLASAGFVESEAGVFAAQPAGALQAIVASISLAPAALLLLSLLLLRGYRLPEETGEARGGSASQ